MQLHGLNNNNMMMTRREEYFLTIYILLMVAHFMRYIEFQGTPFAAMHGQKYKVLRDCCCWYLHMNTNNHLFQCLYKKMHVI